MASFVPDTSSFEYFFTPEELEILSKAQLGQLIMGHGKPIGMVTYIDLERLGPEPKEEHRRIHMTSYSGGRESKFEFIGNTLVSFNISMDPFPSMEPFGGVYKMESVMAKSKTPEKKSSGGYLIPPELIPGIMSKAPIYTAKLASRTIPEPDPVNWAFEFEGSIWSATLMTPDQQEVRLAGMSWDDIGPTFMNAIILMTSAQMAMDETQRAELYWNALKKLEQLGIIEMEKI